MAETGVLRPDARIELLNGEIIDISPIGPFHGGLVKRLSRIFNLKAKGRWIVSTQDPLRLGEKEKRSPRLGNAVRRDWLDELSPIINPAPVYPLRGRGNR